LRKDLLAVGLGSASIAIIVTALVMLSLAPTLNLFGYVGVDLETSSVHMRIQVWKGNELILDEHHAGVVTDIGDNMTLYWIFGDDDMQNGSNLYMNNATYISIGNQGSLSSASTELPGEWNRTAATIEDETSSQLNLTCTFYPASGPYTADCIGLQWTSANATDNNLWGYDTFTEVTGIDDTFTINVEFQVSVSHS